MTLVPLVSGDALRRVWLPVTLAALFMSPAGLLAQTSTTTTAAVAATPAELYRIGPGDTLRITVYQSPDLSLEARVTEAGIVSYPLLGRIKLGGLTVNEAEAAMASALLKGDFVKNAQVIIAVTQVRANQVNVLGQVAKPGRIPLDVAGMRLTEILALAGGIATGTGSDQVVLVGQREGKAFRREVDLPSIFTPGGRADDLVVMPGDTIWVDRAPQIYVYGEVQHPGQQRLERGMTVMQALAAGGGTTQRGTVKGLRVTRRGADGRVDTLEPRMEDTLRDGDVMYVRESLF